MIFRIFCNCLLRRPSSTRLTQASLYTPPCLHTTISRVFTPRHEAAGSQSSYLTLYYTSCYAVPTSTVRQFPVSHILADTNKFLNLVAKPKGMEWHLLVGFFFFFLDTGKTEHYSCIYWLFRIPHL